MSSQIEVLKTVWAVDAGGAAPDPLPEPQIPKPEPCA